MVGTDTGDAVRDTKIALNRLGFYTPGPKGLDNDAQEANFQDALFAFRRAETIPLGETAVGSGTLTDRLIREELSRQDANALYIWHTVGDEKVRGEHAARNGKIFSWANPPEGGNPGEDYNCRCWAEALTPRWHGWSDWQNQRREARADALKNMAPSHGLNDDLLTHPPVDAINPTWSPFDFLAPELASGLQAASRMAATKVAAMRLAREAAKRDVSWIRNANRSQLQKKFKHAKDFGIKGNQSNNTLEAYKEALEKHIKSPDVIEKKGTLHKKPVTHYYNPKTRFNVMKDEDGEFLSGYELTPEQHEYMMKTGDIGGQ